MRDGTQTTYGENVIKDSNVVHCILFDVSYEQARINVRRWQKGRNLKIRTPGIYRTLSLAWMATIHIVYNSFIYGPCGKSSNVHTMPHMSGRRSPPNCFIVRPWGDAQFGTLEAWLKERGLGSCIEHLGMYVRWQMFCTPCSESCLSFLWWFFPLHTDTPASQPAAAASNFPFLLLLLFLLHTQPRGHSLSLLSKRRLALRSPVRPMAVRALSRSSRRERERKRDNNRVFTVVHARKVTQASSAASVLLRRGQFVSAALKTVWCVCSRRRLPGQF